MSAGAGIWAHSSSTAKVEEPAPNDFAVEFSPGSWKGANALGPSSIIGGLGSQVLRWDRRVQSSFLNLRQPIAARDSVCRPTKGMFAAHNFRLDASGSWEIAHPLVDGCMDLKTVRWLNEPTPNGSSCGNMELCATSPTIQILKPTIFVAILGQTSATPSAILHFTRFTVALTTQLRPLDPLPIWFLSAPPGNPADQRNEDATSASASDLFHRHRIVLNNIQVFFGAYNTQIKDKQFNKKTLGGGGA
ncbi:hypothetical protein BDK51DRAFT_41402 [Blyttiomyces helicus]|uniref:Uncharacterized protein n=1 Tax=Blyttiomyces helicus TaxID=388810 RepID=A0A4P9WK15_9FUNG|nr:hypothetical protein BDK51DRAFT_41402 [Blyttiomyces helicus]|eukprot:RKO93134.1 hypothetical protein BDK51DRAFT_41402 [Blyttiomyces helicus]